MSKLAIISRPITDSSSAYLHLENEDNSLEKYVLEKNEPISITVTNLHEKHCVGWYDITTHTNHVCDNSRVIDSKYESCFECRKKTGFNPAFYNTTHISAIQAEYNNQPHSVYISYFGGGLAKAGIMSDSRGLERIYEQGALLYSVIGSFPDAASAHRVESKLISGGLKNSITKRQKETALTQPLNASVEQKTFKSILNSLNLPDAKIVSNIDHFFFGSYPKESIDPMGSNKISGIIVGVVGRYLVLNNNGSLYGSWLNSLFGFNIEIKEKIEAIKNGPKQVSLFG